MNVGLVVALGLASLLAFGGAVFVVTRHFWRLEEEVNEAIARALAEESEPTDEEATTGGSA